MKTIKLLSILFISTLIFTGCSDDDNPDPVNEEEVISIVNITLVNTTNSNDTVILSWVDTDEDGTVDTVTNNAAFTANASYTGSITLANQEEAITPEVQAEDDEHQFFYSATNNIATFSYDDQDGNGNPVGLSFTMNTGNAGRGSLAVVLKHEPTKPNDGTAANAGGSTDLEISFDVTVQ